MIREPAIEKAGPSGRRERKKAETRGRIADSARRLFLEQGYDAVGIRDIAEDADVAVTTLFSHFPSKEALVFELDGVFEQRFVEAVTERGAEESVLEALRGEVEAMIRHCGSESSRPLWVMIDHSPDLRAYEESMLTRHAESLAAAMTADPTLGGTHDTNQALARFIVTTYSLARASDTPFATLDSIFPMVEAAWETAHR
ncbi:TetR/AcrR family transcriptional regulator [Frondihabitans sp. PAMC 28766]|uniref:TetR/AcrR family transcriptional regulator n=1 Tax=Frondihabitans sp. PAMC 28766 TaxID=1795630 RepID=UPI000A940CE7|nr:TetR/AcrR family transcriptional regulator [Frondihabitans sp. PAMC 28766]